MFSSIIKYILAFLAICLYYLPDRANLLQGLIFACIFYGAHYVLLCVWYWNTQKHLASPRMRKTFWVIMLMQVGFIYFMNIHHTLYYPFPKIQEYLWYAYYIPVIFLPVLMLRMYLQRKKILIALWIFGAVLITGVFTNELHQWVFTFPHGYSSSDYGHGFLFYIILIWMVVLNISMFVLALKEKRKARNKENYLGLILLGLMYVVGFAYVMTKPWFYRKSLFSMCEGYMFLYVILIEFCIDSGLYSTNMQHEDIFRKASVSARILDDSRKVCYQSDQTFFEREEECEAERIDGQIITAEDVLIRSRKINGGYIQWGESIHELMEQRQRIEEQQMILLDEQAQLQMEKNLREKQSRIAVQNDLYEMIDSRLQPVFNKITEDLALIRQNPTCFRETIPLVHLRGTYVKRYSNLCILQKKDSVIPVNELLMSFRESLHSLEHADFFSDIQERGSGLLSGETALSIYEKFQLVLEENYKSVTAVMVISRISDGYLHLFMDRGTADGEEIREILYQGPVVTEPAEGGVKE